MRKIVCKFGGSSVADAKQIRKIESIIRSDERRRYVVVSAPGKRSNQDEKITDLLYSCQSLAARGKSFIEPFEVIRKRYNEIEQDLRAGSEIEQMLNEVERQLETGSSPDLAASRGEYLCARMLSAYLGAAFVDAAEVIKFRKDGSVNEASYRLLAGSLSGPGLYVIPGFYGATLEGEIRTFTRGGSDITGALVARAVGAEVYENWTDVSGLLMTDPRLVKNPKPMRVVTYREIRELAYMGARVFHEEAIFPVYKKRIPINIRNTNSPNDPGTMIVAEREIGTEVVTGIAGKKGFSLLFLEKFLLNKEPALKKRLFNILKKYEIAFERERSGIDSIAVLFQEEQLVGKKEALIRDIQRELKPDRLEIAGGLALIAAVGEGMAYRCGIAARLFTALADAGINVRLTDQGSSEISSIIGVEAQDYERAVQAIHHTFR